MASVNQTLILNGHVSLPSPPVSIQIVSTSNASQTVTLVYVVRNRSSFLNGTVASSLLRQLSAELVGFYLTYPPLSIAEREYMHNVQGRCRVPGAFPILQTFTVPGHVITLWSSKQLTHVINGDGIDDRFITRGEKAQSTGWGPLPFPYLSFILTTALERENYVMVQN